MYKNGAVASAHQLATEAGISTLKQGGNAIDAAVSTAFALSVVDPQNSGLGGLGGFATIYLKEQKEVVVVNFGSQAPENSRPDMFVNNSNLIGAKAVSIPTVLKGLSTLSKRFGKLALSESMNSSVRLAEAGFKVDSALARAMQESHLSTYTKKVFQTNDIREGDLLKLPEYAQTLKTIQEKGEDIFYKGEIADLILTTLKEKEGILTQADLANYEVKVESPGKISYHGHEVYFPLFNSGGPTMAQILKVIENFNVQGLAELDSIELISAVMQKAFLDRFRVLENSKVSEEQILQLFDPTYCRDIAIGIQKGDIFTNSPIIPDKGGHTTHLCTVDKEGNMVALTQTNGRLWFGSGMTVKGAGIVLNCGMSQYNTDPKHHNAPQPNRSNLSNMTPTLVLKKGKPFLAIGTPGSRRIITIVARAIIDIITGERTLKAALDQPRIHNEGQTLWIEKDRFNSEIMGNLKAKYPLEYLTKEHFYGSTTGIQVSDSCYLPEVDSRFPGFGGGY